MSKLLYLDDSAIESAACTALEVRATAEGHEVVLDVTPFYAKGGGQPSDVGELVGENGRMAVDRVIRAADGSILHLGSKIEGALVQGTRLTATIDREVRFRHARLHTAGEVICATVHELGFRWSVTAASHVPGQARVAFETELAASDVAGFAEQLKQSFKRMVARDSPIIATMATSVAEAKALCPMDAVAITQKVGPIRLISPMPGFYRPCMGAHLKQTAEIGEILFRKIRLKDRELSISYDLA